MGNPPVQPQISKTSLILTILNAALTGLSAVNPAIGGAALAVEQFVKIIGAGVQAYHLETGQPIDLLKIPLETPAP
jgi:hypothetical protein